MMFNKKNVRIGVALLLVICTLLWGCAVQPQQTPGDTQQSKTFTVTVVHKNKTENAFTYTTTETYLGAALVKEGLVVESSSPGLYNIVDGETADWSVDQSYWCFYIGEDMAMEGMNTTEIHNGDSFKLVYTIG